MNVSFIIYLAIMFAVTYLIRVLPLTLIRGRIKNRYIRSFLTYIPYTVLGAMTFPAILTAPSGGLVPGAAGLLAALAAAYREKSLLTVAVCACAAVFVVERIMTIL